MMDSEMSLQVSHQLLLQQHILRESLRAMDCSQCSISWIFLRVKYSKKSRTPSFEKNHVKNQKQSKKFTKTIKKIKKSLTKLKKMKKSRTQFSKYFNLFSNSQTSKRSRSRTPPPILSTDCILRCNRK